MDQLQWILTIAPAAVRVGRKYNYSIPALIGATCDETGYGTRPLVTLANNVLGMKDPLLPYESTTWDGATVTTETWEEVNGQPVKVQAVFRKYKSFEDCLEDYCRFMRYGRLSDGSIKYGDNVIGKDTNTVLGYLTGRYATDSGYGAKISAIIDKWNLRKFEQAGAIPEPPVIEDRIAINAAQVVQHNGNSHEYLAIHYRGCEGENPDLYGGGYGGHFDVTAKGKFAQAALVTDKIYHVGKGDCYEYIHPYARNSNTIGIECSTYEDGGKWYFTEATQKAAAKLAAWLMFVLEIPDGHLLRHGDITTKRCPAPYMDFEGQGTNWTWDKFKSEVKRNMSGKKITASAYRRGIKKTANEARENGWKYGNSTSTPPCVDGLISCDRLVSRTLARDFGVEQHAGGWNSAELAVHLPELGFKKTTNKADIRPGTVVMVGKMVNGVWDPTYHTFEVERYDSATDLCDKFDLGSDPRIEQGGYFTNVPLCEWEDRKFTVAFVAPEDDGESRADIIARGQMHSIEFTGHSIKVDGDRGNETRGQAFRVLRHALNLDYFDGEMDEDAGDTKLLEVAIGTHYVKRNEKQYMVTAAEILCELRGMDPDGVEYPGHYGDGLATAAGKERIEAADFLAWCRA